MISIKDHRKTRQRELVFEHLCKVCSHPTVKDIYKMVKEEMPEIGLATVYRSLDFLEKEGKILKLKSKNKEARYDGNVENHCHLVCKKCGSIEDIFDVKNIKIDSEKIKKIGFKLELDYLEVSGICKNCQKNKS